MGRYRRRRNWFSALCAQITTATHITHAPMAQGGAHTIYYFKLFNRVLWIVLDRSIADLVSYVNKRASIGVIDAILSGRKNSFME